MSNSRVPVSPLDYNEQNIVKAIPGEMLIDYSNGKIYIKSKFNPYEIQDITNNIINNISVMNADNLKLSLKKLNLQDVLDNDNLISVLLEIIRKTENTISVEPIDGFSRISGVDVLPDGKSVTMLNGRKLQVGNFEDAGVGSILVKTSTGAIWSSPNDILGVDAEGNNENPFDGLRGSVEEKEPDNNRIALSASFKQMTTNMRSSAKVVLPSEILDQYSKIEWCVSTSNYVPILTFSDNVIWKYGQSGESHKAIANAFILYKFETWDHGAHWLAQRELYSEEYESDIINIDENYEDYLNEHYYNKTTIDEKLSWKNS